MATEVLGSVRKEEKDEEQRVEGKTPKSIRFVGAPRPASTRMDACQSREVGDADARSAGGLPAFSMLKKTLKEIIRQPCIIIMVTIELIW